MNLDQKLGVNVDRTAAQSLKTVGELLRQRRQELNLSLKEIENATSIRASYLQALEDGEGSRLISPIYANGFFKQYAAFLGMDGEEIMKQNPLLFQRPETQEFAYGIGTLEVRNHPGSNVKWFPNLLWILAFLAVFAIAWYFAQYLGVL